MSSPVPAKSQPLHNFSLPLLKWTKTAHTNHHHHHHRSGRRLPSSSPPPPPRRRSPASWRHSPLRGGGDDSGSESESGHAPAAGTDRAAGKSEKRPAGTDHGEDRSKSGEEGKSKIYIRLRGKSKCDEAVQNDVVVVGKASGAEGGEVDDLVGKSWNLRPRKPVRKLLPNGNSFTAENNNNNSNNSKGFSQQQTTPNNHRQEAVSAEEKKETNQKFSILLTRQEIEEDIFAMTGSKPARRPRKRAKVVQKQIDNVFPGMWLAAITPDSYKVSEAPAKV